MAYSLGALAYWTLTGRHAYPARELHTLPAAFRVMPLKPSEVVAQLDRPSLMICNGYKDEAYMEMACLAVRLGHEVVVVIEKPSEIETFSRVVDREGRNAAWDADRREWTPATRRDGSSRERCWRPPA